MNTAECTAFLQDMLPRLGLHWRGYRRVRKLVCKRIGRRMRELGLADPSAYAAYCDRQPGEREVLERMTRIPVSRFYRDRAVFGALEREVIPALAQAAIVDGRGALDCWSACCAAGEEPYTLALLWQVRLAPAYPALALHILATDADAVMLRRARTAVYAPSSLRALPQELLRAGFECCDGRYRASSALRAAVTFLGQDIRQTGAGAPYDLVLCRNAVLTYFAPHVRDAVMLGVLARLRPGGVLVVGMHERLPASCAAEMAPWPGARAIYRKEGSSRRPMPADPL